MNIQAAKLELIEIVVNARNEKLLQRLKQLWEQVEKENGGVVPADTIVAEPEPEWVQLGKQPMPDHIKVDILAREQGYDGKRLSEHLRNFDHSLFEDQTLEELLNSLTK